MANRPPIVIIRDLRPQQVSDESSAEKKRKERVYIGELREEATKIGKENLWKTVGVTLTDDGAQYKPLTNEV